MTTVDDGAIRRDVGQRRLPWRAGARDSVLSARMLSLLPAVGDPSFEYSRDWRCYVLGFLGLPSDGQAGLTGDNLMLANRARFVPARVDFLTVLAYLGIALAAPLGLLAERITHSPELAFSGVALSAAGLLILATRAALIRPDLRILLEVIRDERNRAVSIDSQGNSDRRRQPTEFEQDQDFQLAELERVVAPGFLRTLRARDRAERRQYD